MAFHPVQHFQHPPTQSLNHPRLIMLELTLRMVHLRLAITNRPILILLLLLLLLFIIIKMTITIHTIITNIAISVTYYHHFEYMYDYCYYYMLLLLSMLLLLVLVLLVLVFVFISSSLLSLLSAAPPAFVAVSRASPPPQTSDAAKRRTHTKI